MQFCKYTCTYWDNAKFEINQNLFIVNICLFCDHTKHKVNIKIQH